MMQNEPSSRGGTADLLRGDGDTYDEQQRDMPDERPAANIDDTMPLLPPEQAERHRADWDSVLQRFIDEPRDSVKEADELVAEVMRQIISEFAAERESLEEQWGRGAEVSTEELRITLQRYRSFFNRLLKV